MKTEAAVDDFTPEVDSFRAWARWAEDQDIHALTGMTGVSVYGSPPSTMPTFREAGEVEEFAGYREPPKVQDTGEVEAVHAFVTLLQETPGRQYIASAIMANHLRIVEGCIDANPTRRQLARALYPSLGVMAEARLVEDCRKGYALFRKWRAEEIRQAA